ncbi:MAG: hypothetical protein QM638_09010 [Nocardioides sp.]|uniref:hypothetical protein n=1 Tax=Nocardioides sp. TaxID=35761 RepID=UPI0039E4977D
MSTALTAPRPAAAWRTRLVGLGVGLAVIAAGVVPVLLLGIDGAARLAGVLALLAVAAAAASLTAAGLVLRHRLGELRHLPDLGRRYVTRHEGGRVTGISRDEQGLVIHLLADDVQTMVLDEDGAPDHVVDGHAGVSQWRIPAAALGPERTHALESLLADGTPVRAVASGVIGLAGPMTMSWRLEAGNGLVVST